MNTPPPKVLRTIQLPRLSWPFPIGATVLLLILLTGAPALWALLQQTYPTIQREHGPMENAQIVCLVTGIILLCSIAAMWRHRAGRIFIAGISVLHLLLFLNEFDTRQWNDSTLDFFFRGASRNLIIAGASAAVAIMFIRTPRPVWTIFIRWIETGSGVLMCLAGVFWVLGGITDKAKPFATGRANLLAEEALEFNAALLMLISVLLLTRSWRQLAGSESRPQTASH